MLHASSRWSKNCRSICPTNMLFWIVVRNFFPFSNLRYICNTVKQNWGRIFLFFPCSINALRWSPYELEHLLSRKRKMALQMCPISEWIIVEADADRFWDTWFLDVKFIFLSPKLLLQYPNYFSSLIVSAFAFPLPLFVSLSMLHENMRIYGKADHNCMVGAGLLIWEVETSFWFEISRRGMWHFFI